MPDVVAGYTIESQLAKGGMSEVYLAHRDTDDLRVVIKIGLPSADEQTRQRLVREHQLLQETRHPNLVKLIDFGTADDRPYSILEFVPGKSLRQILDESAKLPGPRVADIVAQLCGALEALHPDVLHRDIKPENILVDEAGHVTLVDLSIATRATDLGEMTQAGQFLGTVDYMAPEQRHRMELDHRADIYSLGAVTFEMLTGKCPLGHFRRPSELNPDLDPAVDAVLLKSLAQDPSERFDSVADFSRHVDEALQQRAAQHTVGVLPLAGTLAFAATVGIVGWMITHRNPDDGLVAVPSESVQLTESPRTAMPGQRADEHLLVGGVSEPDENHVDEFGIELAYIPAGSFVTGLSEENLLKKPQSMMRAERNGFIPGNDTDTRRIEVQIESPFWLSIHEITVGQFRDFVEATGYRTDSDSDGAVYFARNNGKARPSATSWNDPSLTWSDSLPVVYVSWHDAVAYCRWLTEDSGHVYRLPTEAEWEYACRAGTDTIWSFGNDPEGHQDFVAAPSRGPIPVRPVIEDRLANGFGLFDMHGNVAEWCADSDADSLFPGVRPDDDELRIVRGGSSGMRLWSLRSCGRIYRAANFASDRFGFRVVRDVEPVVRFASESTK